MSSSYGDGMFYFLKPVGAGPGYGGSPTGYGELAFDGQVYTDGKDFPVQAPLRLGYGSTDKGGGPPPLMQHIVRGPPPGMSQYGRAAKWDLRRGVPTREIRFKYDDETPSDAAVRIVYDYEKMMPNQGSIDLVNEQIGYYKDYAESRRNECKTFWSESKGIPLPGYREACRKYRVTLKVLDHYYKALDFLNRKMSERGARPQTLEPQILRYAPPVVRQGFRASPQTIPSDIRAALARLQAARRAARDARMRQQYEMEIARLRQLLMAQQAAAVQQTAPAVTQYAPAPSVSQAPDVQVPEGAVQAMPDMEDVKERQVVGLDTDASVAAEQPSFIEKYGLFVGLAALAAGGYWYMNRDKAKV